MGWFYYDDDSPEDRRTLSDYRTPPTAIIVPAPVYAESKRGEIGREWWGRAWVQVMEHLGLDGRLDRGKRYARNGSVVRLEISHGMVYAEVRGSRPRPYRTAIELKTLNEAQWRTAFDALSEQAIYAAKLLAGEMPGDIETVFQEAGLSLFPQKKKDISFTCSCPDWGDPCKHAAAVYYLVAEQLDADPFTLFHLRGRSRESVMQALQGYDISPATESDDITHNPPLEVVTFWDVPVALPSVQFPNLDQAPLILHQYGTPPGGNGKQWRSIYDHISNEALRWLGLDE